MEMQWKILNGSMKAQDGVARWMHALIFMQPNGCFINTWTKHMGIKCKWVNLDIRLLIPMGLEYKIILHECLYFEQPACKVKTK
jgi:hypothetical protein